MYKATLGRVLHEDLHYAFDIRRDLEEEERTDEERSLLRMLEQGRELEMTEAEARHLTREALHREDFDCNGSAYQRQANRLYFDLGLLAPYDDQAQHFGGPAPRPIMIDGGRYEWQGWRS